MLIILIYYKVFCLVHEVLDSSSLEIWSHGFLKVVIEVPHRMNGGRSISWTELREIAQLAKTAGARLHMDGARLCEALPFYALQGSEREAICAVFDSIYISWYPSFC